MPPGPLATERLDEQLLRLRAGHGRRAAEHAGGRRADRRRSSSTSAEAGADAGRQAPPAVRLRFPRRHDVRTQPVWAAGEVLEFGGDFNKYVTSKSLQKQEGIIFRHLLRLILLVGEFTQFCPPDTAEDRVAGRPGRHRRPAHACCRDVDPTSTEKTPEQAEAAAAEGLEAV